MHKTLVALALIFATSFATLSDVTITATSNPIASATAGWTITGAADDKIGRIIADIGDWNGDGFNDYAVAPESPNLVVYIILGKATGRTAALAIDTDAMATNFQKVTLPASSIVTGLAGGDVNGDTVSDLVIACHGQSAAYVIYGTGGAATTTWQTTAFPTAGFTITAAGANLKNDKGFVITLSNTVAGGLAVGDFGSDAKADIIIGMPGHSSGKGGLCVVWGKALATGTTDSTGTLRATTVDCTTQALLDTQQIGSPAAAVNVLDGKLYEGAASDGAGAVVAGGYDWTGDGFEDIFVAGTSTKAWLIYGAANAAAAAQTTAADLSTAGTQATWLDITQPAAAAIKSANFIGNFNGDSPATRVELALGHPQADSNKGKVYVLLGQTAKPASGTTVALATATPATFITYSGKDTSGFFGASLDGADVNGDGVSDLIVGTPFGLTDGAIGSATGKVYIIYGSTTAAGQDLSTTALTSTTGITITGVVGSGFGAAVCSAGGDINGDNVADFLVGAPLGTKASVSNTGRIYEIRGQKIDTTTPSGSGATLSASLLVLASFFVALMF